MRDKLSGKSRQEQKETFDSVKQQFAEEFLNEDNKNKISKLLKNLKDYADNTIWYFRLTRYIHIRGNGYYIDLEHRRSVEIEALLKFDNARSKSFKSKSKYLEYMSDISQPQLPWENAEEYIKINLKLIKDIKFYESLVQTEKSMFRDLYSMDIDELKSYASELRMYRRELQNQENHQKSQAVWEVQSYVEQLNDIFDFEDRPMKCTPSVRQITHDLRIISIKMITK